MSQKVIKYYFLKLGRGNNEAGSLTGKRPTATIYFDAMNEAAYERGAGTRQPREFWEAGKKKNHKSTIMIVINKGTVWLLQPKGRIVFAEMILNDDGVRRRKKVMPVKILASTLSKAVPPVLASMGCNQRYARQTFTLVNNHWGNLKAIDCTLQRLATGVGCQWIPNGTDADAETPAHWRRSKQTPAQLLECLSSTELETLVAKLLEAHGCHVPAYRGGTMADIDLFACNDSGKLIDLNGLRIPAHAEVSLQVKSWAQDKSCGKGVDYLIGLGVKKDKQTLDENWLLTEVRKTPDVYRWMLRSLNWLPKWFLELPQFQLAPMVRDLRSDAKEVAAGM